MPYGVDKSIGGDNPANVRWMENCVHSVMNKGDKVPKQRAIMICKAQLKKLRQKKEKK